MGGERAPGIASSAARSAPPIMPRTSWPPMNLTSVPLIRGEPFAPQGRHHVVFVAGEQLLHQVGERSVQ